MKTSILRLFSTGLCVTALAACGDDVNTTGTAGVSDSGATTGTTDDTTPGSNSNSNSNSDTTPTTTVTTGDSQGETQGTTDDSTTTEAGTGTSSSTTAVDTTEGVTEADPECGNGVQEGNEECDDGNQEPGDGCEPTCTITPVCGNGTVEAGEACDDGNTEDGDECSADCQTATPLQDCGNGMVEEPEQCDDGNETPGDGCEPDCTPTPAECGNGVKERGEQCDDGNDVNGGPGDFCLNDCTPFFPASCQAPADYVVCDGAPEVISDKADKTNMLKAMGICNDQLSNSVVISDFMHSNPSNASWQVAKGYGSYMHDHDMDPNTPDQLLYSPREGDTFLMISSGVIGAPNAEGVVVHAANNQATNDNGNPDGGGLPAPFKAQDGSNNGAGGTPFQNCDNGAGDNDCSDTIQAQWAMTQGDANDRIYFTFKTVVPAGTFGYTFEFAFCSAEWPSWVGTSYNDLLIAYQVDPTPDDPNQVPPVDPYSGNVTFIPDPNNPMQGLPVTITALDPYFIQQGYTNNEPQLNGTGFQTHACTDWFTAKGGVQPGAEITVGFFLADMSDDYLSTLALLDNFRWDCEGCIPSEVDDCGVQPM